jgi:site-specific DNA recombinase
MTNRYFLYARKSTDETDKQVRSIDDQIAELRALAEREHLHVVDELDESRSAKVPGRPTFNEMLDRIERGEADGILAWHSSPLTIGNRVGPAKCG